jgi:hypothetical protein
MINDLKKDGEVRMKKSLESLEQGFSLKCVPGAPVPLSSKM